MFLSRLIIDIGDNPDRPRPGRMWLRNIYHVHQRLCMAFPSAERKADDVDFLKPFKSEDFANGQVHKIRGADSGFLFRIDSQPGGRAVILVQSAIKPDWEYAFHNAKYLLAAYPEAKSYDPKFIEGQHLKFRLAANPTRRLSKNSPDAKDESVGKRVPVPTDQLFDWLDIKAGKSGFAINKDSTAVQPGYVYFKKFRKQNDKSKIEKNGEQSRLRSVRYEGALEVIDAETFRNTLINGIGSGKAFGFGLLSVAPVSTLSSRNAP